MSAKRLNRKLENAAESHLSCGFLSVYDSVVQRRRSAVKDCASFIFLDSGCLELDGSTAAGQDCFRAAVERSFQRGHNFLF